MNKNMLLIGAILILGVGLLLAAGMPSASIWSGISPLAITHTGEITYPGDTFEHSFVLTNKGSITLPDLDSSDGTITRLYYAIRLIDQAGNLVQGQQVYEEITVSLVPGSTVTKTASFPVSSSTPSGNYAVSAILFKIPQTWDRPTNTWSTGTPVVIDGPEQTSSLAVQFQVQTPTAAPAPDASSLLNMIGSLFAGIWNFIKSLFSWV